MEGTGKQRVLYYSGRVLCEADIPFSARRRVASDRESNLSPLTFMPRTKAQILLSALTLLIIGIHLRYVINVDPSVPHQDEWSMLDGMFRALDAHQLWAWIMERRSGHFIVFVKMGYLVSLRCFSLNLAPLRLLNFPTCLVGFVLAASVIHKQVKSQPLRFYLYLGVAFVAFNLCLWEHFTQPGGLSTVLSAVLGGVAVYFVAKTLTHPGQSFRYWAVALTVACLSILSFSIGYAALAAAISLFALSAAQTWLGARRRPWFPDLSFFLLIGLGSLALVSHPALHFPGTLLRLVFRSCLVAGSTWGSAFDNPVVAQNAGFIIGSVVLLLSCWTVFDYLTRGSRAGNLLRTFAAGLVLFGVAACVAVALARPGLPDGEFLSSRYTLEAAICLLGLLLYSASSRIFLLAHVWTLAGLGYLLPTVKEQQVALYRPGVYDRIEAAMRGIDKMSDAQIGATFYFNEDYNAIRAVTERCRKDRLNVFRDK